MMSPVRTGTTSRLSASSRTRASAKGDSASTDSRPKVVTSATGIEASRASITSAGSSFLEGMREAYTSQSCAADRLREHVGYSNADAPLAARSLLVTVARESSAAATS